MDIKKLAKANKMMCSMDALWALNNAITSPYPQFTDGDKQVVNSANFDTETLTRLKKVIKDFIETRTNELEKEFEQL